MNTPSPDHSTFLFPEVRVVEASAGSGKTYALAKRYIQLLLQLYVRAPESLPIRTMLALTFTNKAAIEMKGRILELLKRIAFDALDPVQKADIVAPLGIDEPAVRRAAFMLMDGIIRQYNFFQVETIDTFINALLSGCAFKTGLTAHFRIKTNTVDYLRYSLDELIDQSSHEPGVRALFTEFIDHYLYLENRSGWFPKEDMLAIVVALFGQYATYGMPFCASAFSGEDIGKRKGMILEEMRLLRDALPPQTHAGFRKNFCAFLDAHPKGFDVDGLSSYFGRTEFPITKGGRVTDEVDTLWSLIRMNIRHLCEEEAVCLFNPYIAIFSRVRAILAARSAQDDVLFLPELNVRAGQLFDEHHLTVEELYYRLASRFSHYLIDEFQDTSRLQWRNLQEMVTEALSTGGTLFYVGDRKQAIYSFRGGDVALFDEITQKYAAFTVTRDVLTKNWRSHAAIVAFNNAVFSAENLSGFIARKEEAEGKKHTESTVVFSRDEIAQMTALFGEAQQVGREDKPHGYVEMAYIDCDTKEAASADIRCRLVGQLRALHERFSYGDIAILTRGNYEIEELTAWLLAEGIPVESERTLNCTENPYIKELVALLRFVQSPVDNEAFVTFVLGTMFSAASGITSAQLHAFVLGFRSRLREEKDFYLFTEFARAYPVAWETLCEPFVTNVGLYPVYELVVSIYERLQVRAYRTQQAFFMHFLELIKRFEDESADLAAFLDYFDALDGEDRYVPVSGQNAVRLLTIHKAKGLEFAVVILPFLEMDVQVGSAIDNKKQSYVLRQHDDSLGLLRLKRIYYGYSESLYQIFREEYKKAFIAELNTMYVALTRARCELYAYIPKKSGSSINLASFFIPPEHFQSGRPVSYPATRPEATGVLVDIPPAAYRDWISYLHDEFVDAGMLRNRLRRREGEIVHYLLAQVTTRGTEPLADTVNRAVVLAAEHFGVGSTGIHEQIAPAGEKVRRLLGDTAVKDLLFAPQAVVYTEKEIVTAAGVAKRIDRLMVVDDEVLVIEYKTGGDDEHYAEQLAEYTAVAGHMYPGKKVRGFLVFVEECRKEER